MRFSIDNLFSFIAYITPFLVTFYIISIGLMQGGVGIVKSSLYLGGILFVLIVAVLLQNYIGKSGEFPINPLCSVFSDVPFVTNNFVVPSISTTLIAFSLGYLLFPMIDTGQYKFGLLGFLSLLLLIDVVTRKGRKCSSWIGLISGIITGVAIAGLYTWGIAWGDPNLLFFRDTLSNNVTCSKPTNQTFKCAVYKNGKIIQNL